MFTSKDNAAITQFVLDYTKDALKNDTKLVTTLMERGQVEPYYSTRVAEVFMDENIEESTNVEGADTFTEAESNPILLENNMQLFGKSIKISYRQINMHKNLANAEGQDIFMQELKRRLREIKRDLNRACLIGKRDDTPTKEKMDGIANLITNTVEYGTTNLDKKLNEALVEVAPYFSESMAIFVNPASLGKIVDIFKKDTTIVVKNTEDSLGITATKVFTNFGILNILYDSNVPVGEFYIVDLDRVVLKEAQPFTINFDTMQGDHNKRAAVYAEYSILIKDPNSAVKLIPTTTA